MSEPAIDQKPRKQRGKVDIGKAVIMIAQGNTQVDAAQVMGVTKQAVNQRLKEFREILADPEKVRLFEKNEDVILSGARSKLLAAALDRKTIKKSSTLQLTTAYSQLFDKQRLIRGESTQNVSVKSTVARINDELSRLERELDIPGVVIEGDPADNQPV